MDMEKERELILKLGEFENDILEVVDNQEEYTRSDLQGRVMAIVREIYREGLKDKTKTDE